MQFVYRRAAEVLDRLQGREGSLKSIIFNKGSKETVTFRKKVYAVAAETLKWSLKSIIFNKGSKEMVTFRKKVYAVAAETLKCKAVLLKVIQACNLLEKEPQLSRNLALVLLHDLLYGKGIQCGGPLKFLVKRHRADLICSLKTIRQDEDDSQSLQLPRYVRVNQLKTTVPLVISALEQDGYVLHEHGKEKLKKHFSIDPILHDVLIFHSSVSLTTHPLYHDSHIILQDKASCLAAFLLAPPPGSRVIDCCAAPGNKTTHLASIMGNVGLINAFDKDPGRFTVLKERLKRAGATCVSPVLSDFIQINPGDYGDTEYILVDPSCSGSGILKRLSYHNNEASSRRLAKLSSFQFKVLQHALRFPVVKRVVYSTCSVHKEENEMVVHKALQEFAPTFELEYLLPEWSCRGLPLFPDGERCLRAGPKNGTNGFFIAVFIRKSMHSDSIISPQIDEIAPTCVWKSKGDKSKHERRRKKRRQKGHRRILPVTAC